MNFISHYVKVFCKTPTTVSFIPHYVKVFCKAPSPLPPPNKALERGKSSTPKEVPPPNKALERGRSSTLKEGPTLAGQDHPLIYNCILLPLLECPIL